jgi:hypothetical protein
VAGLCEDGVVLWNSTKVKNCFTKFVTTSFSRWTLFHEVCVNGKKYSFFLSCFPATYILVQEFNLWLEATLQPRQRNMKYEQEYDVNWPS